MPLQKRKYKVNPFVSKRQFLRRVALTRKSTLVTTSLADDASAGHIDFESDTNSDLQVLPSTQINYNKDAAIYNSDSEVCDASNNVQTVFAPSLVLEQPNTSLLLNLRQWSLKFNIPHVAITELLHLLQPLHPELPLCSKTLLRTPRHTKITKIGDGEYHYFGLQFCMEHALANISQFNLDASEDIIRISFNVDGLPLFNSSSKQFWPILGLIKNFKSKPFAVGIYSGNSKPLSLELYLEEFINELCLLLQEGFTLGSRKYQVQVHSFICDAPARAFIKCIKSHTGYSSCEKCTNPGMYINGRVVFNSIFSPKRTDQSFSSQNDEDHHIGVSPLQRLGIGLVSTFPIDYMHACCLGVMRKMLNFWLSGHLSTRFSGYQTQIINKQITLIKKCIPFDFNRKLRTLHDFHRWKATELRMFLLYLGAFVLKDTVNKAVYEHFLLFHCAISILTCRSLISKFGCDFANELLLVFVKHCERLYGLQFLVYNVHMLTHLSDDVNQYGPLDEFSCFPFENMLGQIKRLIRSPTNTLQQASRRLLEIQQMRCNLITTNKDISCFIEHNLGPLPERFTNSVCKQFMKCSHWDFILYTRAYSIANSYCLTNKSKVVQVVNFAIIEDVIYVIGKCFQLYNSLYEYPLSSKEFNIFMLGNLSEDLGFYQVDEIIAKCFVIDLRNSSWLSFPLKHTFIDSAI